MMIIMMTMMIIMRTKQCHPDGYYEDNSDFDDDYYEDIGDFDDDYYEDYDDYYEDKAMSS